AGGEIRGPCSRIGRCRKARGVKGLDLARKHEARRSMIMVVVERLHPEPVARGEQRLRALVPDGKREHADQLVEARASPLSVRGEQNLGVRLRSKCVLALQLAA